MILVPLVGLAIAASFFFVLGGFSLIKLLAELLLAALGVRYEASGSEHGVIIFEVVEHGHTFLVGTVLYIPAVVLN